MGSPISGFTPQRRVTLDVLGPAFELFKAQVGVWLLVALIILVIQGAVAFAVNLVVPILGSLVPFATGGILSVGVYRMALKQLQGKTPVVEDLFQVSDVIVHGAVVGLLVGLASAVAAIFCIIPAFIVAGLFLFAPLLVADRRMDGIEALKLSWNTLTGELLMATVFVLVLVLLNLAGMVLCVVGLLVTVPVSLLATAMLYRGYFPDGAPVTPPPLPPPSDG